jgi:predicted metal-binding protein
MINDFLIGQIKSLDITEAAPLDVAEIPFDAAVRAACEVNYCGKYGRSWNCPPVCGSMDELREMVLGFRHGVLVDVVSELEDSFDWEGMKAGGLRLTEVLAQIDHIASSDAGPKRYRVFGSGACMECEACTYPDAPCRFSDRLFLPIEACGIDVTRLAPLAGLRYNNGESTVTFFGMILYDEE